MSVNKMFACLNCGVELGPLGQSHGENLPDGETSWTCAKPQQYYCANCEHIGPDFDDLDGIPLCPKCSFEGTSRPVTPKEVAKIVATREAEKNAYRAEMRRLKAEEEAEEKAKQEKIIRSVKKIKAAEALTLDFAALARNMVEKGGYDPSDSDGWTDCLMDALEDLYSIEDKVAQAMRKLYPDSFKGDNNNE